MIRKVLFDHDDLDAAGCRIVFTLANPDLKVGEDYIIVHCSNVAVDEIVMKTMEDERINSKTEICFSDICASREVMEKVVATNSVKVFDHHRTNFFVTHVVPDATIIPENALGVLESGTSLLFQHYASMAEDNQCDETLRYFRDDSGKGNFKLLADLVDTVRSYDTYEWKETGNLMAKKLQTLFFLLGMDRFCKRYVKMISEGSSDSLITENDLDFVESKLEYEQKVIDSIGLDDVYDVSIKGLRAAFIFGAAGANISEVSYQFLTKHPEFDMFIGFTFARGGEYSFRCTRDDLNTGEKIASPIGGGGHPKASGAPIPEDVRNNIIALLLSAIDEDAYINE